MKEIIVENQPIALSFAKKQWSVGVEVVGERFRCRKDMCDRVVQTFQKVLKKNNPFIPDGVFKPGHRYVSVTFSSKWKINSTGRWDVLEIFVSSPELKDIVTWSTSTLKLRLMTTLTSNKSEIEIVAELKKTPRLENADGLRDYSFEGEVVLNGLHFRDGIVFTGRITIELFADFWIIAENGAKLPCNRVLQTQWSSVFFKMMEQSTAFFNMENAAKVKMTENGARALIKWMEYASVEDAVKCTQVALELLEAADQYEILVLENEIKEICLGKLHHVDVIQLEPENSDDELDKYGSKKWLTVDEIIELFLWCRERDGYVNVKEKAARLLKAKSGEVKKSTLFKKLSKDSDALWELFYLC